LLSLGVAGVIAQAASPNPNPTTAAAKSTKDAHADRRAIAKAVFEAEADVLKLTPDQLRQALKDGKKVSDLANDRHMNKDQFAKALGTNLKPRLEALVDKKVITQPQADKVLTALPRATFPSGTASTTTRRRSKNLPSLLRAWLPRRALSFSFQGRAACHRHLFPLLPVLSTDACIRFRRDRAQLALQLAIALQASRFE